MKNLYIIKIGGNVIDDATKLEKFMKDFSSIEGLKILVHGGGKIASSMAERLGIVQHLIEGRRVTDSETLKIATMVYAGLVNKQLVALLQSNGTNALGLSGADGNVITSFKRERKEIDYGFVGDLHDESVNCEFIFSLLENNITPVFSAITHDGKGQLLNTNADTIASTLAIALSKKYKVQLNFCFEKRGVLKNIQDENSVINTITNESYRELVADGFISAGMIPKLDNAFKAIECGVSSVVIAHADELLKATNEFEHAGTKIVA